MRIVWVEVLYLYVWVCVIDIYLDLDGFAYRIYDPDFRLEYPGHIICTLVVSYFKQFKRNRVTCRRSFRSSSLCTSSYRTGKNWLVSISLFGI
jgi:hypothetical protein